MKHWLPILAVLFAAVPALALDETEILEKAINRPGVSYSIYGTAEHKIIRDKDVQGGHALRVKIPKAGPDPWSVGSSVEIEKPIADADVIYIAFWARAPELKDGETTPIPAVELRLSNEPYTAIVHGAVNLTNQWTLHSVRGRVSGSFDKGQVSVGMHLAAKQAVLEFGPIFVLDLGP